ncbi:MAG: hypothetical protein JSS60_06640 [Verrucomicrobia bacterium]|nr:hypothetical protein [Verrucomicrobiota bacterium]
MLKLTVALLSFAAAGHAAMQTASPNDGGGMMQMMPPQNMRGSSMQSYMMISPTARALDFQSAFETMRKEKTTGKVYFQLADGSTISNVIDMTLLPNSTLFLFRFNSSQGIRFQVVKVEDILNISYSS